MTPIVQQDVVDFVPGLATGLEPNAWTKVLAYVNQFNLTTWDSDEDRVLARIYLCAHILTVVKTAGTGSTSTTGPMVSESVGGIRRSYANLTAMTTESSLNTTPHGRLYLDLLASSGCAGPFLV